MEEEKAHVVKDARKKELANFSSLREFSFISQVWSFVLLLYVGKPGLWLILFWTGPNTSADTSEPEAALSSIDGTKTTRVQTNYTSNLAP